MPYKSIQAAEKAAIQGDTEQWDTQQCRELNFELEALLNSSPAHAPGNQVASTNAQVAISKSPARPVDDEQHEELQVAGRVIADDGTNSIAESLANGNGIPDHLDQFDQLNAGDNDLRPRPDKTPSVQIRRDSLGRLRAYTSTGADIQPAQICKHYQLAQAQAAMDDFTQRSSMSATQENPQYLYEQFKIQQQIREDCPSTATHNDDCEGEVQSPEPTIHDPKHASASTAYTYQENDTGHIHLGFDAEPIEEELLEESQDESYTMPMQVVQPSYSSFEPKTPAPPVNPFQQRGSVMKGFELFGATQPSSIGRHMAATPTSSRPSPDAYNNFSSPPKRRSPILSSPLRRGPLEPESEINDATPLQSSVRNMLGRSQSSRPALSFDAGPRSTWANPEPRPYVSMQESQEKRKRIIEPEYDSSGDESDMETPRNYNRRTERELQIQKELAKVELRKRTPSTNPRSSAPPSSTAAVEVPSTGRRRSIQEDYIAQCSGHDARDTQQDDVIVDSQAAEIEAPEAEQSNSPKQEEMMNESTESDVTKAEGLGQVLEAEAIQNTHSSNPEPYPEANPQPSLPLQEMSSNLGVRTPGNKPQSEAVDTVPETSPPDDRLRPMGDIASISFGASEDLPASFPGFTQDVEFESAMQIRSSPRPPARLPSFERAPKSSMKSRTGSQMVNPVSSATSSTLSSPPNSAVLEETAAEVNLDNESSDGANVQDITKEVEAHIQGKGLPPNTSCGGSVRALSKLNTALKATPATSPTPTPVVIPQVQLQQNETASLSTASLPGESMKQTPKRILRTYSKLKGPSRNLRRSLDTSAASVSPQRSSRVAKMMPGPTDSATLQSTPVRKVAKPKQPTPIAVPEPPSTSVTADSKRTKKRKSGVTVVREESIQPMRASKRQSLAKDSSPDPLALSSPTAAVRSPKTSAGLFKDMIFAVSYIAHDREKDEVTKSIFDQGGRILPDGFDSLFDTAKVDESQKLSLSPSAKSVGFVALIADEHSRKAKYMQALALGLPCISGHWVIACVEKRTIVDWSPYLLCAGQSSILGNAHKSRVLAPYPAPEAKLEGTFATRAKLLDGKSVMLVTGKGKGSEKRKAYTFLAHALGPLRLSQVADYQDARKKLEQEEGWDLLYVDINEKAAEEAVFGTQTLSSSASRKRKRGPTAVGDSPAPKKIRIISDETMIQSLILGQLLDD